jgi:hypothetical protein
MGWATFWADFFTSTSGHPGAKPTRKGHFKKGALMKMRSKGRRNCPNSNKYVRIRTYLSEFDEIVQPSPM